MTWTALASRPSGDLYRGEPAAPRVALLCTSAWSIRNVLLAGTVEELARLGVDVCVVGPAMTGAVTVPVVEPRRVRHLRGKWVADALFAASYARRFGLRSHDIFDRWRGRDAPPVSRMLRAAARAGGVIGRSRPAFDWQRRRAERATRLAWDIQPVREQLRALRPDLLVATSSVVWEEQPYILAARDLGIRVLGCILSFDNLTSRGALPVYDDYVVWNERMRDLVLRIYEPGPAARVVITGTPQFDFHIRESYREPRAGVLARLGIQAGERFILYAANARQFTPSEPALVAAFAAECSRTPALAAHRIVVRLHPLDDWERWQQAVGSCDRLTLSVPWGPGGMAPDDQRLLVGTVREADVCINMASTMSLDAAAVDTPVICVGFALPRGSAEDRFCAAVYSTDHYAPVIASGGVRLACSLDELVSATAEYVGDPGRDREARARLVRAEIGTVDGASFSRVAGAIASAARSVAGSGARAEPVAT